MTIPSTPPKPETSPESDQERPRAAEAVLAAILDVAPDLEESRLDPSADLQQDLGLDSIDLLNVAGRIAERTGVDIPDTAFSELHRVSNLIAFVEARSAAPR